MIPILGSVAASVVSGLLGNAANMSAQERAAALQEKGVQEWLKIKIPDPQKQRLALERFVSAGELTPDMEQAFMAAESEFQKIKTDPRLKESRMRALGSLEEQGYGGESMQDAAAREKAIIESGAANRGRQQSIVSDMQRRGQGGGGLELQARLDAQQAEGDRLATNSLDMESARRLRALNSIAGAGELAGNIESDEFKQKSAAATAKDAINMFNTQNSQSVANRNVNRGNEAEQWNLTNNQDISNRNTGVSNFEQQYNKELDQQRYENEKARAAGLSGQYNQQAGTARDQGQSAAQMWGGIGQGLSKAGMAWYESERADKKKGAY